MDRKVNESVELFRAYTIEEIRDREQQPALGFYSPWRGEDSSSGGIIKTD